MAGTCPAMVVILYGDSGVTKIRLGTTLYVSVVDRLVCV
jgi:hypothetical protein